MKKLVDCHRKLELGVCDGMAFLVHCSCIVVLFGCRISVPYPFQWGAPTFDAGECFAMMSASFVALVEVCSLLLVLKINSQCIVEFCVSTGSGLHIPQTEYLVRS